MVLLDQRILGIAILVLLGLLVTVKLIATGSILDKPKGNLNEVIDLYAMKFDPVLKARESPNWIVENTLVEALKHMILENSSGSIQRTVLERWLRNKDAAYIFNMIRRLRPKDVVEHVYFSSVSAVDDVARRGYLRIDACVNYFRTDGRGDRVDVVMPRNASRLAIETE